MIPTTLGDYAFNDCGKLEAIDLSEVTSLGERAFVSCKSLKTVDLPKVSSMKEVCFNSCSALTSVSIGDGLSTIPYAAFAGCSALKTITLGASISYLDQSAFSGVSSEKIYINAPTPPGVYGNDVFGSTSGTLYVPEYSMVSYKLHDYWSKFTSVDVNPNPVTSLALNGKLSLTSNARIPDSPNVMMYGNGSSFIVNGNKEQTLGRFVAHYNNSASSSIRLM